MTALFPMAKFRILYPQFETVGDDVVAAVAEQASCYVSNCGSACDDQLFMLMVAHLLQLRFDAEDGAATAGAVTSASISSVSVSVAPPPSSNAWSHWLNLTPFGQQYVALSSRCHSGGVYVGPYAERSAFRNAGGRFPRRGRL